MIALGRRAPLICSVLLGVLVISCGGPPVGVAAPPQAQPAVQQQGGLQEAPLPPEEQAAPPPPVVLPPPPPRAAPPPPPAAAPAPRAAEPPPIQRRPSGNAPGVKHELPTEGESDYSDENDWLQSMDKACIDAVGEKGCLRFVYNFSDGTRKISDPGSDYANADPRKYDFCEVDNINPSTGVGKRVPAGSMVTITIVCTPFESNEVDPAKPLDQDLDRGEVKTRSGVDPKLPDKGEIKTQDEVDSKPPNKNEKTQGNEEDARTGQDEAGG